MIRLDVNQGSEEWLAARLGIPTASCFGKLITPKTRKPSSSAGEYRNQLLAEWLVGYPIDWSGSSQWMERGKELEPEARAWYEMERDVEVETVGFILRYDRRAGGSPDGLVGDDGILELKCPALHTHVGYMVSPADLADAYRAQVQGYLYLTGRQWADIVSYNPELPSVAVRVERDEEFIAALDGILDGFLAGLDAAKEQLATYRAPGLPPYEPVSDHTEPAADAVQPAPAEPAPERAEPVPATMDLEFGF